MRFRRIPHFFPICRLVYGSALAENRTAFFLCPPEVADAWLSALPPLSAAIKAEDPRMVWLKDHYLFLYFQDDLCMGPLAADAIKVGSLTEKIFTIEHRPPAIKSWEVY